MTRARIVFLVAALAVAGVLATRSHNHTKSMYRVDAVFDTARGVLPGGRVKIAGASVGVIDDIRLTSDRKALVEMRIDKRFAPFRSDAHCSIRAEGLVGAAVVNCQPGTPSGTALATGERGHPTVPLKDTSVPVSITDFFEIWQAPVRDRLRIILNELGMGLAGRGGDLNDLLLRANPALAKARRALAIIVAQRHTLARSITDSNRAISALASDPGAIKTFIREAATTSALTASHDRALGASIAGLPPLLQRSKDSLTELDALSRTSLPLVSDLHAAAGTLSQLTDDAVPFARDALPSIKSLVPALKQGNDTVKQLGPFVRGLQRFTKSADPAGRLQSDLQVNLRDSGTYESLLKLFYTATASMSRYDAVSHLDPSELVESGCAQYTTTHDDACDYHYVKQTAADKKRHKQPAATSDRSPASSTTPSSPPQLKLPIPRLPDTGIGPVDNAVKNLLDWLLG